jgi:trans-aconitate 3-methyltransferase
VRPLSSHFTKVIGTDPSEGMITAAQEATPLSEYPNTAYRQASAESLPFLADESVDMVVASQAAHWFDQSLLWPELARVLRKGGTVAFWGYKDHVFVDYPKATKTLDKYCYGEGERFLGDYWTQPGRSIVQNKLRDIIPPEVDGVFGDVERVEYEPGTRGRHSGEGKAMLERRMKLGDVEEYVRTWSALNAWQQDHPTKKRLAEGGEGDVVDELFAEIVEGEEDLEVKDGKWKDVEVNVEWGTGVLLSRKK